VMDPTEHLALSHAREHAAALQLIQEQLFKDRSERRSRHHSCNGPRRYG
jgi:hypothetical protein